MPTEEESVPCQFCGTLTRMLGTGMCDGCYYIASYGYNLQNFLRGETGRAFIREALAKAEGREPRFPGESILETIEAFEQGIRVLEPSLERRATLFLLQGMRHRLGLPGSLIP